MTTHNEDHIIVIKSYADIAATVTAKEKLEEAGIKATIEDMDVMGMTPSLGINIKIFANDAQKAEEILAPLE